MKTIEPPRETGPRVLRMRCCNQRCYALLEIFETELKTEKADPPCYPDSHYVTCPHCRDRAYEVKVEPLPLTAEVIAHGKKIAERIKAQGTGELACAWCHRPMRETFDADAVRALVDATKHVNRETSAWAVGNIQKAAKRVLESERKS